MMKSVIDRFEGKFAVLIVGEDEQRINVPRKLLPKHSREGSWLQVEIQNDEVISAVMDEEETANTKQRIAEKLERLRRGDHFEKRKQ
jgi:prophage tail gpP-like protein